MNERGVVMKDLRKRGTAKTLDVCKINDRGVMKIKINDEIFDPLAFRSFAPEERNIREFHEAGVRLMSILSTGQLSTVNLPYAPFGEMWTGLGTYEFERFDQQIEMFMKYAPDAYFNIMLQLDTKDWYLKQHPEYSNSYWNVERVAGDPKWREDSARFLRDAIEYIEGKYGDKVFGYSLMCGQGTEWSMGEPKDGETSPMEEAAFRHGVFRDPTLDRGALDYYRFRHEIVDNAVLFFAGEAKKAMTTGKLVGVYYGYLYVHSQSWLLNKAALGLNSVIKSPDLDMIFTPSSYGAHRTFDGTSEFQVPVDSVILNDKVLFQEIDHSTHIAPSKLKNGMTPPGADSKLKNEFETRMTLRREFVLTRAKRVGMWWFDFFGGYYYSEALMKEVAGMVRVKDRLREIPMHSVSQVAVFGDAPSTYYTSESSTFGTSLLTDGGPAALRRIGAPFDSFSLDDLENSDLPLAQYRLVIFLNAFTLSQERRAFIEDKVKTRGRSLLWLYAPGYITDDGFSLESMHSLTGINLGLRDSRRSDIRLQNEDILNGIPDGMKFGFNKDISPLFEIDDPNAKILGAYTDGGEGAVGYKEAESHTSYYCAAGNVPPALYRAIARSAGVHIYHEGNDPVYVNSRLIGIHLQSDTPVKLTFPDKTNTVLEELFDGQELHVTNGQCLIPHETGTVKLYLARTDIPISK